MTVLFSIVYPALNDINISTMHNVQTRGNVIYMIFQHKVFIGFYRTLNLNMCMQRLIK